MIPGQAQQFFEAAAAQSGGEDAFKIDRSLRFNKADSAFLDRSVSSATNRKTWTWSSWVKLAVSTGAQNFLGTYNGSYGINDFIQFYYDGSSNTFSVYQSSSLIWKSTEVLRDPSAWYHLVFALDTTQSALDDRFKVYLNNTQLTRASGAGFAQNTDYAINNNITHRIGSYNGTTEFLDGYLAEVNFIDGQALAPTEFGETDSNNNWNPKDTSGLTFGTNGFYLKFADNSSNSALGTDSSGNNNTWTVNNLVADVPSGSNGMNVATYTGNGSSQSITGLGFQPDFVWLKCRTSSFPNYLGDVVRGVTKLLKSNGQAAEITSSTGITSFDSDGFTLGSGSETNTNGEDFVAWCWKAGGTAVSNTDGSITSSVSANQAYGFSIVSYTGNGSDATIGHGLASTPKWILKKFRSATSSWDVYHESVGAGKRLLLNTTDAEASTSSYQNVNSSTFDVHAGNNDNGVTMIAYCWSEVPTFSKFGSYTGNGSTSGPTITTGFRPRYIILKASSFAGEDWVIMDTARAPSNPSDLLITANTNSLEYQNSVYNTNFNDDGFTIGNNNPRWNTSGQTYIFAAFAEKPDQSIIDSLLDTPTNYEADSGNNGGNYATLNPLNKHNSSDTISNGNLESSWSGGSACLQPSTLGFSSGKYFYEFSPGISGSIGNGVVGIRRADSRNYDNDYSYLGNGQKLQNGSASSYGDSYTDGDIIGVAVDMDAGTIRFYKNGADQGQAFSGISGTYTFYQGTYGGSSAGGYAVNFGQRPFAYTPPSGYKSLCTQNLADPTIADGSTAMDAKLWTGTGSSRSITGYNFSPDWVWIKQRNAVRSNNLFDIVRGANKPLFSDLSNAELSDGRLTSFDSTGFTLDSDNAVNDNSGTYVGWAWDAGTSTSSNTDGSITSSVRANQSVGFSIVSYTGVGSTSSTIGHGLNAAPEFIITKARDTASQVNSWRCYHVALGNTKYIELNGTAAEGTFPDWANTTPTSSVFSVGGFSTTFPANENTIDYIAYCFTSVAGYSAFGSYTGNGSSDGPFVYTGFRPRFIIMKSASSGGSNYNWAFVDTVRSYANVANHTLAANLNNPESYFGSGASVGGPNNKLDILSNGFKPRENAAFHNTSGVTYIYMAWAEHPFKTARAR